MKEKGDLITEMLCRELGMDKRWAGMEMYDQGLGQSFTVGFLRFFNILLVTCLDKKDKERGYKDALVQLFNLEKGVDMLKEEIRATKPEKFDKEWADIAERTTVYRVD